MTRKELNDQINEAHTDIRAKIDEIMKCTNDDTGELLVSAIALRARQLYLASSLLRCMDQHDSLLENL